MKPFFAAQNQSLGTSILLTYAYEDSQLASGTYYVQFYRTVDNVSLGSAIVYIQDGYGSLDISILDLISGTQYEAKIKDKMGSQKGYIRGFVMNSGLRELWYMTYH